MYDITKFNPKNPKFVVYILDTLKGYDNFMSIINKFNSIGINVIILSFIFYDNLDLSKPNLDVAIKEWTNFTPSQRQLLKNAFNGVILVSHGGASGTTSIANYNSYGYDNISKATWDFVKNNNLDGVDIDYEHAASCEDVTDFTNSLAKSKPDKYLITMAPEMSICQGSCWDCTVNIYKNIPDKIDWFNLQYYNQDSNVINTQYGYQYTMLDSTLDQSYQTSLKEIITGKKVRIDADKDNSKHCAYQYSRPPQVLPCPDITSIPSYKLILGSCVEAPSGCVGTITPTIASNYIVEASKDPNFISDWFKGGGMMVWLYKSNEDFDYKYNKEIFNSFTKINPLFSGGPTPDPTPDPTGKCKNVNCNKYGLCNTDTGTCNCYYGYSGDNCEKLPNCTQQKLKNIKDELKNDFSNTKLSIGIVLIIVAILIFIFYIFYKIIKILICGIILFIIGVVFTIYYSTHKNYSWNIGKWSECKDNKQTRTIKCLDKNKNMVDDKNCKSSKPSLEQQCGKDFTCNCNSNYDCLQKNGKVGTKDDNLCVECQS